MPDRRYTDREPTGFPTRCARCAAPLRSCTVSTFNTETICIPCKDDEVLAPGYAAAREREEAEVRRGNYRFPGVGLSDADRTFLAQKLEERRARGPRPREGA